MKVAVALLYLFAFIVVQTKATCVTPGDTATYSGQATYYGAYTNGGACTLDPTPLDGLTSSGVYTTVAIADNIWAGSAACGLCVNITPTGSGSGSSPLPRNSFLAFVNNECPSCGSSGIDLGMSGDGIWGITWKPVPCPVGSSNIQFLLQGSNPYYLKLQIRNTRYTLSSVSIIQSGTARPLVRTADNFWNAGSSVTFPLATPFQVQITATTGDVITDSVPSITNGVVLQGSTQFLDCSGRGSTSAPTVRPTTVPTTAPTTKPTTAPTSKPTTAPTTAPTSNPTTAPTTAPTSKPTTPATSAPTVPPTSRPSTAPTTKPTSSATSKPTSAPSSVVVYDDKVEPPFQDWSWATVHPQATAHVFAGSYSYGFSPSSYQAAYFANPGGINSATVSSIEFYIFTSSAIPSAGDILFALVQGSNQVNQKSVSLYVSGGSIPVNTWTKGVVPMSSFPAGTYDGMWFQDSTGRAGNPEAYLDNIRIIGK